MVFVLDGLADFAMAATAAAAAYKDKTKSNVACCSLLCWQHHDDSGMGRQSQHNTTADDRPQTCNQTNKQTNRRLGTHRQTNV